MSDILATFMKAPAILIHLDEERDEVVCKSYGLGGREHTNVPPRRLKSGYLPLLWHQLLLAGYYLQPYEKSKEMFIAMSPEYMGWQKENER